MVFMIPNINGRILSLSHNDCDGVLCQILLSKVFKKITYLNVSFYKIDETIAKLDFNQYDTTFITDLHPSLPQSIIKLQEQKKGKLVLIDHHNSFIGLHDPTNGFIVVPGVCGAILVRKYLERTYGANFKQFDSLLYLINDYDIHIMKNPKTRLLHELLYGIYNISQFRTEFADGRTQLKPTELEFLRKRRDQFNEQWDKLDVFDLKLFRGCVIVVDDFINEFSDMLIHKHNYELVVVRHLHKNRVSIRHNIKGFNIGTLLKKYNWGGGHEQAAGMRILSDIDFKEKVDIIEQDVANYLKEHSIVSISV